MKRILIIAVAASIAAGCSEAKRFGYKGADLAADDMMFFTTAPAVTNWVPARVLSVCENYPMTQDEEAIVAAAGVIAPGVPLAKIPDGYAKSSEEPWFTMWTKEAENFGRKGVNGFLSHWDEDKNEWETGETYFSSYYPDEAGALATLAATRKAVAEGFSPKKFYDFDRCWVAEYRRIRVMCLVGQKPDGKWSCMLDINDKCLAGCGPWEPLDEQSARLAERNYRKAMAAWKTERENALAANHAAVEKARAERGLQPFDGDVREFEVEDGRKAYMRTGICVAGNVADRQSFWNERAAALAAATGVALEGDPSTEQIPSGYIVMGGSATNDIYDVRLDVAFPPPAPAAGETAEGEPAPAVEWREICIEKMQSGIVVPPRPEAPAR